MGNPLQKIWFFPVVASILWWTIRLSLLGRVPFETGVTIGALSNFGLLVLVIFLSDFWRDKADSFLQQLKANLQPGVLFACLAAGGVGLFHHGIAAEATALRQAERERFIEESLSDPAVYAELQAEDPQLAALDRDTAKQRALDGLRFQFNPMWHVTASLLSLLLAALSTGVFVTFLSRWLRT
ncbi:MAG: hypothetical protein CBC74_007030 [Crocinitomicaceae bacterium TMED114]|nr:MAG: hypothetical protein CBC74_007030 [Crocinitomicaceae bacterium TMED114]